MANKILIIWTKLAKKVILAWNNGFFGFLQLSVNGLSMKFTKSFEKKPSLSSSRFFTTQRSFSHNLFFVSNSLLYTVDRKTTKKNREKTVVVLAPMWLEKVHPSFYANEWGKTPLGLPEVARSIVKEIYPNHPSNNLLRWEQILEIRNYQIDNLKKKESRGEIILYDLREKDIRKYEQGRLLRLDVVDAMINLVADGEKIFSVPENELNKIYNFLSLPRELPKSLENLGLTAKPSTELYYFPPNQCPESLLISGSELTAVWLRKHFPQVKNLFVLANDKNDKLPVIPSNKSVDYHSIRVVTVDDLVLDNQTRTLGVYDSRQNEIIEVNPKISYFTAIGYRPYAELTDNISKNKKVITPDTFKNDIWTAPQNIPAGSLTHRLLTSYHHNEDYADISQCYEMQYNINHATPLELQHRLNKKNIAIDESFFINLEKYIKTLDNPEEGVNELKLYLIAFSYQNPTDAEITTFKTVISEMQLEIKERKLAEDTEELPNNYKPLPADAKQALKDIGTDENYKKFSAY